MTNPDNIVRVRARLDGRASVYEANGWAQGYTNGLLSGNGVLPNTVPNMNVLVGGSQNNPDVVIAENPDGYRIALDIVGQQAVAITAPAFQNRVSAIVAYTDDLSLSSTDSNTSGSPSSCGLIVVNGNSAAVPTPPSDSAIRTAITADGATGSQACYAIIASIVVGSSSTAISSSSITINSAQLAGANVVTDTNIDFTTIDFGDYSTSEVATNYKWVDGKTIYKKTVSVGPLPNSTTKNVSHGISGFDKIVKIEGWAYNGSVTEPLPMCTTVSDYNVEVNVGTNYIVLSTSANRSNFTQAYVTVYYTKTS